MEEPDRRGLMLVRLVGVMFVVATILELGLYWVKCAYARPPVPMQLLPVLPRLTWAVIGFVILIKARAIAEWISNILE